KIDFKAGPPVHTAKPAAPAAPVPAAPAAPLTGAAKTLDDAERLYSTRDQNPANLAAAKQKYLEVLEQTEDKLLHADAYYGLARIAALSKDPETADRMFRNALDLGPGRPPRPGCWCIWASWLWRPKIWRRRNSIFSTPCRWMAFPTWRASKPRMACGRVPNNRLKE